MQKRATPTVAKTAGVEERGRSRVDMEPSEPAHGRQTARDQNDPTDAELEELLRVRRADAGLDVDGGERRPVRIDGPLKDALLALTRARRSLWSAPDGHERARGARSTKSDDRGASPAVVSAQTGQPTHGTE